MQLIIKLSILLFSTSLFGQNPDSSSFIEINYYHTNKSDQFLNFQKNECKKFHRKMVSEGTKSGWYLYKVKFPQAGEDKYNYVEINAYKNWSNIENGDATLVSGFADKKLAQYNKTVSSAIFKKQLYRMLGLAVGHESKPSKYLMTNEVDALKGQENDYVKMELTYFKPFHTARAVEGIMNNWSLYRREVPYGDKFASDYITINGYATWEDITKQNPPGAWKRVHGDLNFNEIHNKILAMRGTVNIECWELIDYVIK
jgi:hypothetical protein